MQKTFPHTISESQEKPTANTEITLPSLRLRTQRFFEQEGRRPRVLVGTLQRQEGIYAAEQLGARLAEMGFDVDLQPVPQPADYLAALALDNDVHAVALLGVGIAAEPILRNLMQTLDSIGGGDILLALDHSGLYDRLSQGESYPLVHLADVGLASAAHLLDALEHKR